MCNSVKFCTSWMKKEYFRTFHLWNMHVYYSRLSLLSSSLSWSLSIRISLFSVFVLGLCEMRQSDGQKAPLTYVARIITGKKNTYKRKLIRLCMLHMPSHETIMDGNLVPLLFSSFLIMIQIKFQVWFENFDLWLVVVRKCV